MIAVANPSRHRDQYNPESAPSYQQKNTKYISKNERTFRLHILTNTTFDFSLFFVLKRSNVIYPCSCFIFTSAPCRNISPLIVMGWKGLEQGCGLEQGLLWVGLAVAVQGTSYGLEQGSVRWQGASCGLD